MGRPLGKSTPTIPQEETPSNPAQENQPPRASLRAGIPIRKGTRTPDLQADRAAAHDAGAARRG